MKAHELTESGYYWFTPGEDSPEPLRQRSRWTGGPTELVSLTCGGQPTFAFVRGPGHAAHSALLCGGEFVGPLRPPATSKGCRAPLAPGQHWAFCGETDMGQTEPALCTECGGEFVRAAPHAS